MTRRENTQHRRRPERRSRPLVLVVCGAECTEWQYFTGLRASLRSRAVDFVVMRHAKAPLQVVEYALKSAERNARDFDEIWCIIDVDDFDLPPAVALARRSQVELAISNPCFELWLILHFEDCHCWLETSTAQKRIMRHLPAYDKARLNFADFEDGVTGAVSRAKALDTSGGQFELNPSTSVWRLVERMSET